MESCKMSRTIGCRLLLVLLFLLPAGVESHASPRTRTRYPINVSLGTHSLTVPWYPGPVAVRLNPALLVGAERTLKSGRSARYYQTANLGFFRHYWWMSGVSLDTELGVSRSLTRGIHADLRLGVGYLHYFWRRETLELRNGKYVEVADWGRPSLLVPLTITLGYRGSVERPLAVAPFVFARWAAQVLFLDEVPAATHFVVGVGGRIGGGREAPDERR